MDADIEIDLLNEMVDYAERPLKLSAQRDGGFRDMCDRRLNIRGFKPGVADRLIFKSIIADKQELLEEMWEEIRGYADAINYRGYIIEAGRKLMGVYYSRYGYELLE